MKPLKRQFDFFTYLVILAITMAGLMHAPWWSAAAGACILALLPFVEQTGLSLSPRGVGRSSDEPIASLVALMTGCAAASAAFALGRATAWLWGL